MSSKHLLARFAQPQGNSETATPTTPVLSPNETLQEQMSRLTKLRIHAPEYAARLMKTGQAVVSIAEAGNGAVLMESLSKLRPGEVLFFFIKEMYLKACCRGDAETIHVLTLHGLNPSDNKYRNIPFQAIEHIPPSLDLQFARVLEVLNDNGFDINQQRPPQYLSLLHLAVGRGLLAVVNKLITLGADANSVGQSDAMPLPLSVRRYSRLLQIANEQGVEVPQEIENTLHAIRDLKNMKEGRNTRLVQKDGSVEKKAGDKPKAIVSTGCFGFADLSETPDTSTAATPPDAQSSVVVESGGISFGTDTVDSDGEEDPNLARLRQHLASAAATKQEVASSSTTRTAQKATLSVSSMSVGFGFEHDMEADGSTVLETKDVQSEPHPTAKRDLGCFPSVDDKIEANESGPEENEETKETVTRGASTASPAGEHEPSGQLPADFHPDPKTFSLVGSCIILPQSTLPGPLGAAIDDAFKIVDTLVRAKARLTWKQDAEVVKRETIGGRTLVTLRG